LKATLATNGEDMRPIIARICSCWFNGLLKKWTSAGKLKMLASQ